MKNPFTDDVIISYGTFVFLFIFFIILILGSCGSRRIKHGLSYDDRLKESKIVKPCIYLKDANDTAMGVWLDFILIRKDGQPDMIRLMEINDVYKLLSRVSAAHDYAKCLEGGILQYVLGEDYDRQN